MPDLERIAAALESIADSLLKLANPPVMAEPLNEDGWERMPGAINWVPNYSSRYPLKDESNA